MSACEYKYEIVTSPLHVHVLSSNLINPIFSTCLGLGSGLNDL